MTQRRAYPSDLSDARWALIEPTLTAWRQARTEARVGGRPPKHDLRELFNAILYVNRAGIPWRYLPHDFLSVTWNQASEDHGPLGFHHGLRVVVEREDVGEVAGHRSARAGG